MKGALAVFAGLLVAGSPAFAQGAPGAASQVPPTAPSSSRPAPAENKRMFGMMPAYGVVEPGEPVSRLNSGQKFRLALRYIDPYTFATVAVRAGIEQATDAKHDYGQGMEGYGKRYGADFTDGLTNSFFVTGFFPSLLHQDPRYYRRGQGSFWERSSYAATRVLVGRMDSGRHFLNVSEILGNAASSGISTAYYPDDERTAGDFAVRAGIQFGFDAGFDVMKEFYPDIMRKLFKKKAKP